MKKTTLIITMIIVLSAVSGGAFYGGIQYNKNQTKNSFGQRMSGFQQGDSIGLRAGGGMTAGEILSKDDKSIAIKLSSGGSKIIFFSDATTIGKFTNGSYSDLTVGESVTVSGATNTDGSITAQTIQIRPITANPTN